MMGSAPPLDASQERARAGARALLVTLSRERETPRVVLVDAPRGSGRTLVLNRIAASLNEDITVLGTIDAESLPATRPLSASVAPLLERASRSERTFQVITIDNVDISAARVIEIFDVLRTMTHARVVYLLTGSDERIDYLLTSHFQTTLGGGRLSASRLSRERLDAALPRSHRFPIDRVAPSARVKALQDSLPALRRFLLADDLAAHALPAGWRSLRDLEKRVASGIFEGSLGMDRLSAELWETALLDSRLGLRRVEKLRHMVHVDERQSLLRVPRPVPFEAGFTAIRLLEQTRNTAGGELFVRGRATFAATLVSGITRTILDDGVAAAWMLANNLTREQHADFRLPRGKPFDVPLVESYLARGAFGAAELPGTDGVASLAFRWPVPEWRPYVETQELCRTWNELVTEGGEPVASEDLARAFLVSCSRVSGAAMPEAGAKASFDEIADAMMLAASERHDDWGTWVCRYAMLLAAPQAGLPVAQANAWLSALVSAAKRHSAWPRVRVNTRIGLADWMHNACIQSCPNVSFDEEQLDALVNAIDASLPRYDFWRALVEKH